MKSGEAIFTEPLPPMKCAGAPQKIVFLLEDLWTKNKSKPHINISFHKAVPVYFGVPRYAKALEIIHKERKNEVILNSNLIEIKKEE